ncbi:hypothetical protein FE257_004450 [Aspergillus nanangensis]|uniref:Catalase n=1 Tax=Aspergillus nanangensis TaxID=2582783 RepID=A0AAD4CY15_ASPNN|nr:hypothetical protein FE257_004450 [Aspergillus nanangensis]
MPPYYTLAEGRPLPDDRSAVQVRNGSGGGLVLLQDTQLVEGLAHFARERIPERVVHAKAAGAFGTFEVTHDCTDITSASFLSKVGKKTDLVARISAVTNETGYADTVRDVHGWAMKFYTDEGNQDFVFNNTPVFFIRDPQKFPSLNHSHKRHPATNLTDQTMFWDFHTGSQESIHQLMVLFSDRGTPASLRHMNAYSGHTYKFTKDDGSFKYVKFHIKTTIGVKSLTREQAQYLAGENPDFLMQDMYEAIDRGDYPEYNVFVQVMDPKEAETYKWNIFDMTKVWPHEDYPLRQIGRLTFNRNVSRIPHRQEFVQANNIPRDEQPKNYFVDVEQAAFSPSTMVPGIAASADQMLQARMFSYPDAQRHRLGTNYQQLPINAPHAPVHCPYSRSGAMNFSTNYGGEPNYSGSSLHPTTFAKSRTEKTRPVTTTITEHEEWVGKAVSYASEVEKKDYEQAAGLWKVLGREEGHQERLVGNVADKVRWVKIPELRKRVYEMFSRVDGDLGKRIEKETEGNLAKIYIINASNPPKRRGISKRLRTALACSRCRQKKRKCDGAKPVCGGCRKRGISQCQWDENRDSKQPSHQYVESLKSQIRSLEGQLNNSLLARPAHPVGNSGSIPLNNRAGAQHGFTEVNWLTGSPEDPGLADDRHSTNITLDTPPLRTAQGWNPPTHQTTTQVAGLGNPGLQGCAAEADTINIVGSSRLGGERRPRPRQRSDYFGPSSTINILNTACRAIGDRKFWSSPPVENPLDGHAQASPDRCASGIGGDSTTHGDSGIGLVVPPRVEADALLQSYWTFFHSLYPFLHRPSFDRRYGLIWSPSSNCGSGENYQQCAFSGQYDETSDGLFHCLLNVVFAIGCLFHPGTNEKDRERFSLVFFNRAKGLIDFDMLSQGRLIVVQIMVLMSNYLQSIDMSSSCWNMGGMAIRIAQGIGLHHDTESCDQGCCPEPENQLDQEMNRRVWTGCILLDRFLSWTYGRPLMIHPTMTGNDFVFPSGIDDRFLTRFPAQPGSQPENIPSMVDCFIYTAKIQDIAAQVLTAFYSGASHDGSRKIGPSAGGDTKSHMRIFGTSNQDFQKLFDFENTLLAWFKSLPAHLKLQAHRDGNAIDSSLHKDQTIEFLRQAIFLQTRYLHCRVLTMLCPVLTLLSESVESPSSSGPADTSLDSTLRQEVLIKAARRCMTHALEKIDLLVEYAGAEENVLPPPWYNVYYIHGSATMILIGCILSSAGIHCLDEASFQAGWNKCLAFLRGYSERSDSERCSKMLQLMQKKVLSYQNGIQKTSPLDTIHPDLVHTFSGQSHTDCDLQQDDPPPLVGSQNFAFDQISAASMEDLSDIAWFSLAPFLDTTNAFPL